MNADIFRHEMRNNAGKEDIIEIKQSELCLRSSFD